MGLGVRLMKQKSSYLLDSNVCCLGIDWTCFFTIGMLKVSTNTCGSFWLGYVAYIIPFHSPFTDMIGFLSPGALKWTQQELDKAIDIRFLFIQVACHVILSIRVGKSELGWMRPLQDSIKMGFWQCFVRKKTLKKRRATYNGWNFWHCLQNYWSKGKVPIAFLD